MEKERNRGKKYIYRKGEGKLILNDRAASIPRRDQLLQMFKQNKKMTKAVLDSRI